MSLDELRLTRREFVLLSGEAAAAAALTACLKAPELTPPPLPDLLSQDEAMQKSPINVGKINLTLEAFGGEAFGQKNLDTLQKALEDNGFEKDGIKHKTVSLWAPIVAEKILMYAVHEKTPQVFTIGRLYAFHVETQRFTEVPVLLRGKISSDGFELNSVQPILAQTTIANDHKKRSYEVRAASLKVSEDGGVKKAGLEVVNPLALPLFSYEIESTWDDKHNPTVIGTQRYALDVSLINSSGSKAVGDSALINEGIFLRFITPAQEVTSFKEQPASLRESQVSEETKAEIARLITEQNIKSFEITTLAMDQWGGGKISSDAALIFTSDQVANVLQSSGSETIKRPIQGKYFLAVKTPKVGQENPSIPVKNIGLSAQENPSWKLVDLNLRFVDNGNGDTYLEVSNEQFGVRFTVAAKIVDKKLQVTGEQIRAYVFAPAKLSEQSSPLQIFGENLQKMFGEIKEVEKDKIIYEKNFYPTEEALKAALKNIEKESAGMSLFTMGSIQFDERIFWDLPDVMIQQQQRFSLFTRIPSIPVRCAVLEKFDGTRVANILYVHQRTKENPTLFFYKLEVPLDNLLVQQLGAKLETAPRSLGEYSELEKLKVLPLSQTNGVNQGKGLILFSSPLTKESPLACDPKLISTTLRPFSKQYVKYFEALRKGEKFTPFSSRDEFNQTILNAWKKVREFCGKTYASDVEVLKKVMLLDSQWFNSGDVPEFSVPKNQVCVEPGYYPPN